jgi:MarR family 2-MHQ and catechol resistance regulon transcriptional repressor
MAESQLPVPASIHAWLILWKATRAVEICAHKSIQALGLGLSDFGVLEVLLHTGALPVNEIGNKVLLTSSSMTAAVDRLESQGLVARKNVPEDRRAKLVCLTAKGTAVIASAFEQHSSDMESVMSVLSATEMETLVSLLRKLGHAASMQVRGRSEFSTDVS